eukprot:scaffold127378_cov30-Tisochrysis_lutea.AAC.1
MEELSAGARYGRLGWCDATFFSNSRHNLAVSTAPMPTGPQLSTLALPHPLSCAHAKMADSFSRPSNRSGAHVHSHAWCARPVNKYKYYAIVALL